MATKDIQIIPESVNDYADVLHPETNVGNVMGGAFPEIVKAHSNTSNTVAQIRSVIYSPNVADVNLMQDGEMWIKYK